MRTTTRSITLAAALFALVAAAPSTSFAWQFSDQCAPRTEHDTAASIPAVYTILDRSGSMRFDAGYDLDGDGDNEDRWEASKIVIDDVATATHRSGTCNPPTDRSGCDKILFGLGYFGDTATAGVPPGEDTLATIQSSLSTTPLQTDTYTGVAADLIADSPELQDASRPSIGVVITDGIAEDEETMQHAIERLCEARERATSPIQSYVVGFSGDADQALNSILAAAGGTGQCCYGNSANCDPADRFDPCEISDSELDDIIKDYDCCENSTYMKNGHTCSGSKETSSPSALKDELLSITGAAACTFPLDVPSDYPTTGALDDPDATDVTMFHDIYGEIDIPYFDPGVSTSGSSLDDYLKARGVDASEAAPFDDDGFYFTSNERNFVRLTEDLCGAVKSDYVSRVETQVACPCENGGEPCSISGEQGRCAQGVVACTEGESLCISLYRPMPEICNNIDDDCDGSVDDLFENEEEWNSSAWEKPGEHAGLSCYNRDVCVCPNGVTDALGSASINLASGATESEEFNAYLDSWTGACQCGVGLGADDSSSTPAGGFTAAPADEPASRNDAACSTTTHRPVRTAGLMIVFAIGALLWRRRC
jgi:hypothetical protein